MKKWTRIIETGDSVCEKRTEKETKKKETQERYPKKSTKERVSKKHTSRVSKKTHTTCFQKNTPKRPTKPSTIETQHEHTPVSIWTAIMQLRDSVFKKGHTKKTWRQKRACKRDPKKT